MNLQWQYEKPVTTGLYLINYGDVVTDDSLQTAKIIETNGILYLIDQDDEKILLDNMTRDWKFCLLNEAAKEAPTLDQAF